MKKICLRIGIILVAIAIVLVSVFLVKGKTYKVQNPIATIQIEGYENPIKLELDPQVAPNAVANFIKLANSGFYKDFKMTIESNRILGNESMQKAKLSNIMENPTEDYVYGIKGDFIANDFENLIRHKKGVITMERDDYSYFGYAEEGYNSANCNFCILTEDIDSYDGYYAAFGHVIEGMDVLEAIAATRVEESNDEDNDSVDISDTETTSDEETTANEEASTEENSNEESEDTSDDSTSDENTSNEDSNEEDDDVNTIKIINITVDTFGVDYGLPEYVNYEENMEKVNEAYSSMFGGSTSVTTD